MKKEVKKCQIQTLGGGIRRAPIAFGLSAVLCMPAAFASANNNSLPAAQSVQTVSKGTTVKGKIIDENNEPLIGVSVILKGSTTGTITDIDGNFEIAGGSGKNVLEISYLGYLKQNVNAENNKFLNIKLEPDTKNLDEVVVIGYGTMKKRDLTGAVASVKSEDITMSPVMNPMQALQGRVAGLDITKSSGQAGATPDIQLRGNRSFTATGSPTFIIDGLPGDYNTLNTNDIQSIEVLKDASSTAIYGSGGANGVILITTKNGQPGKVNINFNAFVGFNGFATLPNMRSGNSYIDVLREARQIGGTYSDDENLFTSAAAYQAHLNGDYIDWADELMQTGSVQNYSFSASGGTDKTKAYFSLNFSDEKGMYTNDNYKVYSSKLRVDHKIRNWVTAGVDVQMSHVYQNRAYAKLINALTAVPLGSAYNEDGSVNINPVAGDGNFVNLLVNKDKSVYRNNNQNTRLYINPYIEFRPFKGFSYQTRISGSLNYTRNNYFQGIGSYQYYEKLGADAQGTSSDVYAQIRQNRGYGYTWENVVNYNFTINKDHEFALTAVTSWGHSQNDNTTMKQDNIEINS